MLQSVAERKKEALEQIVTCPVCLEVLFEPITATCRHSVCRACLRRLFEYDSKSTGSHHNIRHNEVPPPLASLLLSSWFA